MPRDVYEGALAFVERSEVPVVRLLGGEPTEHPAFADYVELALERGFRVTVFTGGLMPDSSLECLRRLGPAGVDVLLNAAVPGSDDAACVAAQERVCAALGPQVQLGLTLRSPANGLGFLMDLIDRHGLRRRVRLGVAHPIWGGANASLRPQGALAVGSAVEAFVHTAEAGGVEIDFDCGMTPCMFSREFLASHAALSASIGTRCNPIIDVLPEGSVISCYALSRFRRVPLTGGSTRDGLVAMFDEELELLLPIGVYRDCALCEFRSSGRCNGGCRARRASRLRPDALRLLHALGQES